MWLDSPPKLDKVDPEKSKNTKLSGAFRQKFGKLHETIHHPEILDGVSFSEINQKLPNGHPEITQYPNPNLIHDHNHGHPEIHHPWDIPHGHGDSPVVKPPRFHLAYPPPVVPCGAVEGPRKTALKGQNDMARTNGIR